jgi:excisionase family DNA binding protein
MDTASNQNDDLIEWLSTKAAAKRLGITLRTLYRFIDEGRIPAYQFADQLRPTPPVG